VLKTDAACNCMSNARQAIVDHWTKTSLESLLEDKGDPNYCLEENKALRCLLRLVCSLQRKRFSDIFSSANWNRTESCEIRQWSFYFILLFSSFQRIKKNVFSLLVGPILQPGSWILQSNGHHCQIWMQ
jgi:hypothetical protein